MKTITRAFPKLPGDKSISHRLLLMSSLAEGISRIYGLSDSEDVESTRKILNQLGVHTQEENSCLVIHGEGPNAFKASTSYLDCGNSGTTARHFLAMLAFTSFESRISGDGSLCSRPMLRVAKPMNDFGAQIQLTQNSFLPAHIMPSQPRDSQLSFELKIASGQLKSALLLGGVAGGYSVELSGQLQGRDHTERLIPLFGGRVDVQSRSNGQPFCDHVFLPDQPAWQGVDYHVPKDPSAAAFWVARAILSENLEVEMANVCLNPTRIGFFQVLQKMGAQIELEVTHTTPEVIGTIRALPSKLRGITVSEVTSLIDEVPLLAMIASAAQGQTFISGAKELKVKETDRISSTAKILNAVGINVNAHDDGFEIVGPQRVSAGHIDSFGDHRMAMLGLVLKSLSASPITVTNTGCASVSDPEFERQITQLDDL